MENELQRVDSAEGSMSAMSNGYHDEEEESLVYKNPDHGDDLLKSIAHLRKSQKFCDVKLVVDTHEIFAHKAILAARSPALFDLFSKDDDSAQSASMVKLKDTSFKGFTYLLDYMYTGRLEVPATEVDEVYATACRLRLPSPAKACADFLSSNLSPANCLGVRACAEDDDFCSNVNQYAQDNIEAVINSKHFFSLPRIQLEVVGTDVTQITCGQDHVFDLALDWVKASIGEVKPKIDRFTEKDVFSLEKSTLYVTGEAVCGCHGDNFGTVNVLYLSSDNVLRDCKDVEDDSLKQDISVQDYKKLIRRQSGLKENRVTPDSPPVTNGKQQQPFHKFDINPEVPKQAKQWTIVAGQRTKEHTFLCIMMWGRQMVSLSLHFRIPQSSPSNSGSEGPDSPTHSTGRAGSFERLTSITPLGTMSTPRCAFGIRAIKGKIFACGGYDRGEIMKSAEMYDPEDNAWKPIPDMMTARCRFTAAHLDGRLYAIGGSNGHNELADVECYDPEVKKWSSVAKLSIARASPGVAVLRGKIYCVGGSNGQKSLRKCEVYDPETNKWSPIASLNTGRFQACVRAFKNRLYAVGGTDGWNVFSTVEIYNPDINMWEEGPALNVARRGAGIEAFSGKLYIVGGSDGTQSLKTTESFDPKDYNWVFNPPLSIPRANVGAAVIDNKMFAVGGYCGKRFLDTMEYFDVEQNEWCRFEPFSSSRSRSMSNASDSDSVKSGGNDVNGVGVTNSVKPVVANGH